MSKYFIYVVLDEKTDRLRSHAFDTRQIAERWVQNKGLRDVKVFELELQES